MTHRTIAIDVPTLTRVEGEGALHVHASDGEVTDLRLEIYEPPRLFEALLRGRRYDEPMDITARICGICPVAYQMSAANAMERLAGVSVDGQLRELRRLLYAGEWISSHVLHIALLHAPDFLDASSGIELAGREPQWITQLLRLKRLGNDLMEIVGGRAVHPVNVQLGGFHRAPERDRIEALAVRLDEARSVAIDLVRWTAAFEFPELVVDHELVSLRHPSEYPMLDGRIVSDRGIDVGPDEFAGAFDRSQVAHSTALHAHRRDGGPCLVGPLARWSNNADRVPHDVRELAGAVGIGHIERNPYRSVVIRSLEVLIAIDQARRVVADYVEPAVVAVDVPAVDGVAHGVSEAPRGVLYHRYRIDSDGTIRDARIVPPTSLNLPVIEADLRGVVEAHLAAPERPRDNERLRHRCERVVRNYDPCISCAAHFLNLHVDVEPPAGSAPGVER